MDGSNTRVCPVCRIGLNASHSASIELDVCPNCHGIWFDAGEFDALLGRQLAGQDVEGTVDRASFVRMEGVPCPSNHGQMLGFPFGPTELEFCRTCRGFWVSASARAVLSTLQPVQRPEAEPVVRNQALVVCFKCDTEVERRLAVFEQDAFWCNACVLKGDYPGARGLRNNVQMTNARVKDEANRAAAMKTSASHQRIQHPIEALIWNIADIFQDVIFRRF